MLKLGFDAKRLFHNFTGLGNYSRFVIDALLSHYPDNRYFLFTPKISAHKETEKYLTQTKLEIIQPQGWQLKLKAQRYWRTYGLVDQIKQHEVQIYHGLSNELPRNLPLHVKRIVSIHDLIFLRYPQYYNKIDALIYKKKVTHACNYADLIIAVSQQTADDLVNFLNVDSSKIKVVYQGCHANFKKEINFSEQRRVSQRYQLPEKFILSVGTIEKRKNAAIIIESLKKLDEDTQVLLVGKHTIYADYLKKLVIQYGLTNRVHFREQITFADLPYVYQQAEVFVYPSLFEGFGIPIIEAIASGVPVITSTGSCFSEAGGPSTIYVDPHDSNALADAISKVKNNPVQRVEIIAKNKIYIDRFSPEIISRNLMELYHSVLA